MGTGAGSWDTGWPSAPLSAKRCPMLRPAGVSRSVRLPGSPSADKGIHPRTVVHADRAGNRPRTAVAQRATGTQVAFELEADHLLAPTGLWRRSATPRIAA